MSVSYDDNKKLIKAIGIGVLSSLVLTAVLTCLFALVINFMPAVPYGIIDYVLIAIEGVSVLIGSYIAAAIAKSRGWLIGGGCALIVLLILLACGMGSGMGSIGILTAIRAAALILLGLFGGIRGVNRKEKIRIK